MRIDELLIYVEYIAAAFKAPPSRAARLELQIYSYLGCQGLSQSTCGESRLLTFHTRNILSVGIGLIRGYDFFILYMERYWKGY